ncbi:MAG: SGNH/GDSL hydrolase family protein [Clostridia bacterium]|nr:SGNH/GDSL hydrolase family protein [Clostridia bacterium]
MFIGDKERIVFTGDSVTDSGRKRHFGEGLWEGKGNGYVRMIENFLNVCYPERTIRVTNTGISGNNTNDLLARFDKDVLELNPTYAVICIGFNDEWRCFDEPGLTEGHISLETYKRNLETMVEKCKSAGVRPIFMTPYYLESNEKDSMRAMMDEYRAGMKEVAEKKEIIYEGLY